MTHCSLSFDALDKRLNKKMNIGYVAKELCADVDDRKSEHPDWKWDIFGLKAELEI
jgi:hypothetical protein